MQLFLKKFYIPTPSGGRRDAYSGYILYKVGT